MTEDTITKLGKLITEGEGRDAVHIAVAPVISNYTVLYPAQPLCFTPGSTEKVEPALMTTIGIVDPYLQRPVMRGQRFWMFLLPATITSLRHVWTHPAFTEEKTVDFKAKSEAETWLRDFIYRAGDVSYETVIATALAGPTTWGGPDALCFGDDISGNIPDEFWDRVEIVTGKPMKWRPTRFRCAC